MSDPDNTPITILPSSTELFFFYAQNLEQCAKLSAKSMLIEMFSVWGKWLKIYAGLLMNILWVSVEILTRHVFWFFRGCLIGEHETVNLFSFLFNV